MVATDIDEGTTDEGFDPKRTLEIWETATNGSAWLWVTDPRNGGYAKSRVGGPNGGIRRIRISVDDRRYNEEQVIDGNEHLNPFRNGLLTLVGTTQAEDIDTTAQLSDEDLQSLLDLRDPAIFEEAVTDIRFELPLRRLKVLAETNGTQAQNQFLNTLLRERYPVGGTQRVVQEMLDEEERSAGTRLS